MRRRGVTLAELLVAVVLGALVAGPAVALWRTHRRVAALGVAALGARAGALEVLDVVGAVVRGAASVRPVGDTALLLRQVIREGLACADGSALQPLVVDSPLGGGVSAAEEWWRGRVEPLLGTWMWSRLVDTLGVRPGCPLATPAALIQVTHLAMLTAYQAGDGQWMVGWRTCSPLACGVVQPIAGPVRSRANGGFRVWGDASGVGIAIRVPGLADTLRQRVGRT
ncbi:MAG: hypothetical protein RL139_270 [Gemmatimonadota bacterium]